MSKSEKRRKARERATKERPDREVLETPQPEAGEAEEVVLPPPPPPLPLNEALYEQALEAATRAGVMREEGDRLSYLYNGPELSMKYVEASETEGATLLVAAFRQGVVLQVRDGEQVVYRPGEWEREVARLATGEPPSGDVDEEG